MAGAEKKGAGESDKDKKYRGPVTVIALLLNR